MRNNTEVQEFSVFLKDNALPVTSKIENNILESDYIQILLKILEIIENPYANDISLLDVMRSDIIHIENTDIIRLNQALYRANYARNSAMKLQIFDVISDSVFLTQAGVQKPEAFFAFRDQLLEIQRFFSQHNIILSLSKLMEDWNIIAYIEENGSFDDIEDVYTFFAQIKKFASVKKEIKITDVLRKIKLYQKYNFKIERQIQRGKQGGVQVLTAHAAKGLEYEVVFIPHLISGNWDEKKIRALIKLPENLAG